LILVESGSTVKDVCREHGIEVTGVTKGVCGHPEVAKAMLRGGVSSIGDSRLKNIDRLRQAGVEARLMLIRVPALSAIDTVVGSVEMGASGAATVATLDNASGRDVASVDLAADGLGAAMRDLARRTGAVAIEAVESSVVLRWPGICREPEQLMAGAAGLAALVVRREGVFR